MEETVTCMDDDPFPWAGLQPVRLTDQATIEPFFGCLNQPLSDYTFSQLYTWRNSLRILWQIVRGHLCIFANGSGDLTLLLPPIGDGNGDAALAETCEIMDGYNADHGVADHGRIEYASEELLARFDCRKLDVAPMGADYVYDVRRMIDLAGGDLASKRQARNRFMRNYEHRVEAYHPGRHLPDCLSLLEQWKTRQDQQHTGEKSISGIKREKEMLAAELTLQYADTLGLRGLVVYVKDPADGVWAARGFTFGEELGRDQSSIVVEKTDLAIKGLAQFIFSEFCRIYWSERPWVNVGDDWGLPTLAWTKNSYRPVRLLRKYVLRPMRTATVGWPTAPCDRAQSAI